MNKALPLVANSGGADSGVFTLSVEPTWVAVGGDSSSATCFVSLRGLVPRDLESVIVNQLLCLSVLLMLIDDRLRLLFSEIFVHYFIDIIIILVT